MSTHKSSDYKRPPAPDKPSIPSGPFPVHHGLSSSSSYNINMSPSPVS